MTLVNCLILAALIFAIGVYGMVTRRNAIAVLLAIELMFAGTLINLVAFARFLGPTADIEAGILMPLFVISITACEMALALALVVALHRERGRIDVDIMRDLKGGEP